LFRYADDKWNMLTTKIVSSDANKVNYEAETPGFSYFAIGSITGAVEVGVEVPEEALPPTVTPPEEKEIVTPPAAAGYIWLIVLVLVVIIVIIFLRVRKKSS